MLSSALLLVATAFTGLVSAQASNYSTSGALTINPDTVPLTLRQSWCVSQRSLCPGICNGTYSVDTCDANTLDYTCTCGNPSLMPNISDYINTMPYYICTQWRTLCTAAHPDDLDGQAGCHSVICGSKTVAVLTNPTSVAPTSTPSTGSNTATTSSSSTSPSGSASPSPTHPSAGNRAIELGQTYGSGIMAVGLLAVFGLAL